MLSLPPLVEFMFKSQHLVTTLLKYIHEHCRFNEKMLLNEISSYLTFIHEHEQMHKRGQKKKSFWNRWHRKGHDG